MTLTLEQFRGTGRECDDLGAVLSDARWEEDEPNAQGRLYLDVLYIEKVLPHWPENTRKEGGWHLILGNQEWVTDDLARLEALLYEFALSEGYCDDQPSEAA